MDLSNIMQQAQQMQSKVADIQKSLEAKKVTGNAGGGMVNVTVNGKCDIISIEIEDVMINADEKVMLQDLIVAATNDAIRKAQELSKSEMKQLTGGLNIPGLSNLF
jgi:nucleoid-associated protein EbfC